MTKQGVVNLFGVLLLPVAAVVAAWIATLNGVWNAYSDTYVFLFLLNCVITVPAGLISGLLLRRSSGDRARWIAILPTLVPAGIGACWYLFRAVVPARVAAGAEYVGAPQYLLIALVATLFLVLLVRVTGIVPRTAR